MLPESLSPPPTQTTEDTLPFTLQGLLAGARKILPLVFGDVAFGLVYGVLAHQAGMTPLEVFLMSCLVFAGSAQLTVLSLWTLPLPIWTILLTTLIVNARNLLLGASLSPWFSRLSPFKTYPTLFLLADENWALTMGEFNQGRADGAFLLGSGLVMYVSWAAWTTLGSIFGALIPDPAQWGLDFSFTAVFLFLLVGFWKGKADLLPWLVAAIVAVLAAHFLPGKWYILLGALAGSFIGALRYAD